MQALSCCRRQDTMRTICNGAFEPGNDAGNVRYLPRVGRKTGRKIQDYSAKLTVERKTWDRHRSAKKTYIKLKFKKQSAIARLLYIDSNIKNGYSRIRGYPFT